VEAEVEEEGICATTCPLPSPTLLNGHVLFNRACKRNRAGPKRRKHTAISRIGFSLPHKRTESVVIQMKKKRTA